MSDTKKIFKLFYIFDLEKEENWLREMSNKGLFFQKVNYLGIFTFKKGSPQDTIYKIDFNTKINDMEEYLDIFREGGWNYLYQIREFKYFRYTGDVANYNAEIDIYNDPKEKLSWLRKWLAFFMSAYSLEIFFIYSYIFWEDNLREDNLSIITPYSIMLILIIVFFTFILSRFINSYTILKKKAKQTETKDYYDNSFFKKFRSAFSLLIFPLITFILLAFLFISSQTAIDSKTSFTSRILTSEKSSIDAIGEITHTAEIDLSSNKIILYGSDKRFGIAVFKKVPFDRYKLTTNFSIGLPSNQFVLREPFKINGDNYNTVYGLDRDRQIDKINLIYSDGSLKNIQNKDFIRDGDYFFIAEKNDKAVRNIKVFNKDNADITDEYVKSH